MMQTPAAAVREVALSLSPSARNAARDALRRIATDPDTSPEDMQRAETLAALLDPERL